MFEILLANNLDVSIYPPFFLFYVIRYVQVCASSTLDSYDVYSCRYVVF